MGGSRRLHHEGDREPRSQGQNRPLYVPSSMSMSYPSISHLLLRTLVMFRRSRHTRPPSLSQGIRKSGRACRDTETVVVAMGAAIFRVHCPNTPCLTFAIAFSLFILTSLTALAPSLTMTLMPNSEHLAAAGRPDAADRQAAHAPLVPHVPEPHRIALALREPLRQLPASRMGRAYPAHAPAPRRGEQGKQGGRGGEGHPRRKQGEERMEAPHQDVQYVFSSHPRPRQKSKAAFLTIYSPPPQPA